MKKTRNTLERQRKQYRIIYELLDKHPRIRPLSLSKKIGTGPKTAGNLLQKAFDLGYVSRPQIRKRAYANFIEYVYFVSCEDPLELYLQYSKDNRVVYHAVMNGFVNLWVIAKERIDIEGNILVGGPRSDYHVSFAPNYSWRQSINTMRAKIENFNPEEYEPQGIIKCHWDETIKWDEKDEILFGELKCNNSFFNFHCSLVFDN